jgi:hypothetical protein
MRKPEDDNPAVVAAAADVLAGVRDRHQAMLAMQAAELADVVAWADLHLLETPVEVPEVSGPGPRGTEGVLFLAGPGAHGVEEFAVCDLATTLGMSERGARMYVGEALELRDRLPRLYAAVLDGVLPAWRARQIARQTRTLSPEVAAYVDAHLAPFAHKVNATRVTRAVEAALLHCDPEAAKRRAAEAAERRHVSVEDHLGGISTLTAILRTPEAVALEQRVFIVAEWFAILGDTDTLPVRQSKALALLADPQAALDFEQQAWNHVRAQHTAADDAPVEPEPVEEKAVERTPVQKKTGPVFQLHLHLSEAAVSGLSPVVRVEGPGRRFAVPLAAVEQWLAEVAPGTRIHVTPVVDANEHIAVDRYEVPPDLARQIDETQHVCAFPYCGRRGRYDLDHIIEYIDPDDGGPPGQTSSTNLARLCRFHHRVKTHTTWTSHRTSDGALHWTSPTGAAYRVDPTGTTGL